MEEKIQGNQTNQPKAEQTPTAGSQKKVKSLTIAILLIVILSIVAGAVYAGYFLGRKSVPPAQILIDNGPVEIEVSPTPEAIPTTPSTDENSGWKMYSSEKIMDYFSRFEIGYPASWELTINQDLNYEPPKKLGMLFLKLKKEGVTIEINQAAMGGEGCLYPGEPDREGPFVRFGNFTQMVLSDGTILRRSRSLTDSCGGVCYSICQKSKTGFQKPTKIGAITFILSHEDEALAKELDQILKRIKILD